MLSYIDFVEDITYGHCANTISKGLSRLEGVREVRVDVRSRRAEVDADEAVPEGDLRQAFSDLGYPAELVEGAGEDGGRRGHRGDHMDAGACHVG